MAGHSLARALTRVVPEGERGMPGDGTVWVTWAEQQDYELVARSHATGHSSAAASLVAACVRDGVVVNVADAYRDARFDRSVDDGSGFRTRSVLCVPVFRVGDAGDDAPKVVGAVQFLNNAHGVFSDHDERAARMLASHVAIFLDDVLE